MADMRHKSTAIRSAREGEELALTELAMRSVQQRWNYPPEFMAWAPEHIAIEREHITGMITNVLEVDGHLAGLYILRGDGPEVELSRLMVAPEHFGTGCGRRLWEHAVHTARERGAAVITLDSDPNAEPFYLRMGAETVGVETWEPPMMPGWRIKAMRYVLPQPGTPKGG